MADAQIVLSYSRDAGIVAIATGVQYRWAHTALEESGFHQGEVGIYRLPCDDPDTSRATVTRLIRCAERHRTSVSASSRRFIGDAAGDIARLLPGQWDTKVEIYTHSVWQADLVPWLWDSGELGRAVQTERIPYAALLTHTSGATLLLVERPGHHLDYLLGAMVPQLLGVGFGDPHAPTSIVLPPSADRAAQKIVQRYLPAYDRAVHARRTAAVTDALDHIRTLHGSWTAMVASGRHSATGPLAFDALGAATVQFLDSVWGEFQTVLDHAPALLDRCRPATSPWPEDADSLARLADALSDAETVREDLGCGTVLTRLERNSRTWPAVETWLTHSEPFLRQARAAMPPQHPAPAVSTPLRALPPGRSVPRR
ncbi:hypothetical protein ACF06Q_08355 [Streptomyces leeuwenhoekii]|uniref:hypothetical protein n=1 Tax=Streptomyces leeuwenhoekii TaxID=1437453 RepID=UPI0036FB68C8